MKGVATTVISNGTKAGIDKTGNIFYVWWRNGNFSQFVINRQN